MKKRNVAWDRTIWTKLLDRPDAPDAKIPAFSVDEGLMSQVIAAARKKKIAIDVLQEADGQFYITGPNVKHGPLSREEVPRSLTEIVAGVLEILGSPEFMEKDEYDEYDEDDEEEDD